MRAYRYIRWLLCTALFVGVSGVNVAVGAEPSTNNALADTTAGEEQSTLILKTLPLHHLNAEQLVEQLAPFVPAPGTIAVVNHRLVINSNAHNIAEIEALLQQLDTPAEELTLSVRFSAPQEPNGLSAGTNHRHYQTRAINQRAPQVRTQTQQPTRIAQSHIQEDLTPSGWGGFNRQRRQSEGYELYATIALNADTATIELATRHFQGNEVEQDLYDIETRVSGPVGQWLALTPSEPQNTSNTAKHYQLPLSGQTIYIKVERARESASKHKQ
ncbi:secretin N-terminal domain-containing protein [uncultured Gilvimarinus sp.]|uniref:secretin N-terminal domain-containing protein n=1 Tax=uncultured Gilvimarinus sp. TaxID=1689143 RepID=UPI0030D8C558